jgi:hypothetical protein
MLSSDKYNRWFTLLSNILINVAKEFWGILSVKNESKCIKFDCPNKASKLFEDRTDYFAVYFFFKSRMIAKRWSN